MPVVRATSVTEDMIVARDVTDASGRVILRAGTRIDQDARVRLFKANIRKLEVRDPEERPEGRAPEARPRPAAAPDPKSATSVIQADLLKIAHMFEDYREDPLMRELCRLAIKCAKEGLLRA